MNHWPFIIAAYSVTILSTLTLVILSFAAMRRAESDAEALRR